MSKDIIQRIEAYLPRAHKSDYGCEPCNLLREALAELREKDAVCPECDECCDHKRLPHRAD